MNAARKKRLQMGGWAVGTTRDFLNLSEDESAYIDIKLRLASKLSNRRRSIGITQVAMAKKIGSSQSRVAKMEAGDPSVTIDLLVRSLIAVGEKTLFADDR
jgi:DNA-binding XRE family transcriptional regulator